MQHNIGGVCVNRARGCIHMEQCACYVSVEATFIIMHKFVLAMRKKPPNASTSTLAVREMLHAHARAMLTVRDSIAHMRHVCVFRCSQRAQHTLGLRMTVARAHSVVRAFRPVHTSRTAASARPAARIWRFRFFVRCVVCFKAGADSRGFSPVFAVGRIILAGQCFSQPPGKTTTFIWPNWFCFFAAFVRGVFAVERNFEKNNTK